MRDAIEDTARTANSDNDAPKKDNGAADSARRINACGNHSVGWRDVHVDETTKRNEIQGLAASVTCGSHVGFPQYHFGS
jgi:hypothetical protein